MATADHLHFHILVACNGRRQQVAYIFTFMWNSMVVDSRSPSHPLFSGIQWMATTGRLHLHFLVDFNEWRQQVAYTITFQWNSIVGDSRSHTYPLVSGFQ